MTVGWNGRKGIRKFVTQPDGFEEVVVLFDADLTGVETELRAADFTRMVGEAGELGQFAASVVRAAFAVVGVGLALRSVVFFSFKVDEEGHIDRNFNLPLRYLADNAGPGPDLGSGVVKVACRGRCPVPWHSVNLWEPREGGDSDSIQLVQKAIWRNRLSLKPSAAIERTGDDTLELTESHTQFVQETHDVQQALEGRLTDALGEAGAVRVETMIRQHNERVLQVSDKYRSEMLQQQQGYLQQIKSCREEIRELRTALRHEQERSRRLQALLRGEP
jgi:hypothetical protein